RLHGRILRRLEGVDRTHFPVAEYILRYPVVALLKERHVVQRLQRNAMTTIEGRVAPVTSKAIGVLRPARRYIGRKDIRRRVVHRVTPSPRQLKLQAVGEVTPELRLQAVVLRRTPRHEP